MFYFWIMINLRKGKNFYILCLLRFDKVNDSYFVEEMKMWYIVMGLRK